MPGRVKIEVQRANDSTATSLRLRSLRVVDEAGSHLMAKAKSEPTSLHTFSEGDPVVLRWGMSGRPATSLMYVHRVGDISSRAFYDTAYDLMLVGASWPLKTSNQRAIRGTSAEQVLATIAGDHGLAHDFRAVRRNFDLFVSHTSDWAALRDLSKRVGGLLRVDGTTIRLLDMNEGLNRLSGAPVFSPRSHNFEKVRVSAQQQDSRRREMALVHANTRDVQYVNDDLWADRDDLDLVDHPRIAAGSPVGAQQSLRAARLSERFREVGEITSMRGDPRIRPGEVVGFRDLTPLQNGYWTVTKSVHSLGPNSFTTRVELGRSGAHPRHALDNVPFITEVGLPRLAGASLRQNRWVAT